MADNILIVEDTATLSMVYRQALTRVGHSVVCAFDLAEARGMLGRDVPDLVLLDLQLPDGDGLDLLAELRASMPQVPVIVITANGSINRAVQAMRTGAFDFMVKPFDDARLVNAVQNALAAKPHVPDGVSDLEGDGDAAGFEGFISRSQEMTDIYRMIRSIGRSTATVFITGESGTGKDVCARAIHANSTRANRAFVPLNCAAIPRDLLESEVFGHLKGAFTGALSDKPGAAAVADRGTLFLDEICEMDLSLQTKLLRFLQTSTIQPVGAPRPTPVDVRIVCATNRDPLEEVRAGRFREDLYYRLHVVPIRMPALRGRKDDILEIARSSLLQAAAEEGKSFTGFDPDCAHLLANHPWPGNVRQLLNVIRNVAVLHDGLLVTPGMLPTEITLSPRDRDEMPGQRAANTPVAPLRPGGVPVDMRAEENGGRVAGLIGLSMAEAEREIIEATIAHCGGSIPRAARMLELSPSTIYRKIETWNGPERRSGG